jgi:hypothetical protein
MKLLIDTDWFSAIKDLDLRKQREVLEAILDYPNKESDTNLWRNVIKPALEKGKIGYFNKINHLKQYNPQKSGKKNSDTESDTDTRTESKEKKYNNSRVDISLLDTTRTRAKTVEEILQETTRNLSSRKTHTVLITPDFVFPKNQYFDAYRKELPTATTRTEQWLRRSNMVGKQITETKLGQIIQKFATSK